MHLWCHNLMVLGEWCGNPGFRECISACAFRDIRSDEGWYFVVCGQRNPTFDGGCNNVVLRMAADVVNRGHFLEIPSIRIYRDTEENIERSTMCFYCGGTSTTDHSNNSVSSFRANKSR